MFTDDLVLLADTTNGLQESINSLEEFSRNWDLSINIEKSFLINLPVAPNSI